MSDEGKKYGSSARGLWRRVYGYQNSKPQLVEVIDTQTSVTRSIDLNKTIRHRDYYIVDGITANFAPFVPPVPPPTGSLAEYDEGIVEVNTSAFVYAGNFNFTFSDNPIIALSIEDAALHGGNLNVFGISLNTSQFTFSFSSDFSGSIRYRAINAPTYPAYVTSAYTASITASAGTASPGGLSYYTASFSALPSTPFSFRETPWYLGLNVSQGPDVATFPQTSSSVGATSEFSSELQSTMHFIAFSS